MKSNIEKLMDSDNPYVRRLIMAFIFFVILIPIYKMGKSDGMKTVMHIEIHK